MLHSLLTITSGNKTKITAAAHKIHYNLTLSRIDTLLRRIIAAKKAIMCDVRCVHHVRSHTNGIGHQTFCCPSSNNVLSAGPKLAIRPFVQPTAAQLPRMKNPNLRYPSSGYMRAVSLLLLWLRRPHLLGDYFVFSILKSWLRVRAFKF